MAASVTKLGSLDGTSDGTSVCGFLERAASFTPPTVFARSELESGLFQLGAHVIIKE